MKSIPFDEVPVENPLKMVPDASVEPVEASVIIHVPSQGAVKPFCVAVKAISAGKFPQVLW